MAMQPGPSKELTWQNPSLLVLWEALRTKILARKFVQDVGVLTIANFVAGAMNFVQGILVARWLGPEFYGLVALTMSYPSLIYAVFDARSVAASVRYLGEYHARGERDRALAMCQLGYLVDFAVAGVTFVVLWYTAPLAAEHIVQEPTVASLMILYGGALVVRALMGTSSAILITLGRFSAAASIDVGITFFRMVLVIGFVVSGWQVAGVVWANALAAATSGLCYGVLAWGLIRRTWGGTVWSAKLSAIKDRWRQIFSFIAYTDLATLVATIPNHLDVIALGYFRGPTEVGFYKLAKSIALVVRYLTKPLQTVSYPALARLAALDQRRAFLQRVRKLMTWVGLPLGFLVLLGAVFISWILPMLVGEAYRPAVAATQLLCIGAAFSLAFFWTGPVYMARDQVRQMFIISSSIQIAFALFYPFVVQAWGYLGASSWMLALHVVGPLGSALWLWKHLQATSGTIGKNVHTMEKSS